MHLGSDQVYYTNLDNGKKVFISFESDNWKFSMNNSENISWKGKTRITEITAQNLHQTQSLS